MIVFYCIFFKKLHLLLDFTKFSNNFFVKSFHKVFCRFMQFVSFHKTNFCLEKTIILVHKYPQTLWIMWITSCITHISHKTGMEICG